MNDAPTWVANTLNLPKIVPPRKDPARCETSTTRRARASGGGYFEGIEAARGRDPAPG